MYYLFLIGRVLASILPRNICYSAAKFLATLHFYFSKKDREAVIYNLSQVVKGKKDIEEQAKQVFINFSYYLVDFFRRHKLDYRFIKKYVQISNLENLNLSIAQSKGVIILGAHLGNYELAGAITSLLGYPLSVIALPHKDKRLNRFFDHQRHMSGMKVISTGASVRGCIQALENKRLVALLGDRNFSGKGLKVKMFSKYTYIPRGIAFFALKTGAPITPVFLVREKNRNFYRLEYGEPIFYNKNDFQDEQSLAKKYISILEKYIKKYPGQWYMFKKYWLNKDL
ncbi:MAG: lysophospholipid acyltransferase family protein [Candidatus Omnitrophota bacterium]